MWRWLHSGGRDRLNLPFVAHRAPCRGRAPPRSRTILNFLSSPLATADRARKILPCPEESGDTAPPAARGKIKTRASRLTVVGGVAVVARLMAPPAPSVVHHRARNRWTARTLIPLLSRQVRRARRTGRPRERLVPLGVVEAIGSPGRCDGRDSGAGALRQGSDGAPPTLSKWCV